MKTRYQLTKYSGINYCIAILGALVLLGLTNCTKNFDKYNTDPSGIANKNL
jgi:hypothetical protein